MGSCNDKEAVRQPKEKDKASIPKQGESTMEEQPEGQEIANMPSTDINPKTKILSNPPVNHHSQKVNQKNSNNGALGHPQSGRSNTVEDSLGYMGQYNYNHKVLPPSDLQTSARVAKLQDPQSIPAFTNPQIVIGGSQKKNRNQTYHTRLDQINEHPSDM